MIIKVQITVSSDDGEAEVVKEVVQLQRETLSPVEFGLRLEEAKTLLSDIQQTMIEQQADGEKATDEMGRVRRVPPAPSANTSAE